MIDVASLRAEALSCPVAHLDTYGVSPSDEGSACAAIPVASLKGWRTDIGCASTASSDVLYEGRVYPICQIHRGAWELAFKRGSHHELAARWGWARA